MIRPVWLSSAAVLSIAIVLAMAPAAPAHAPVQRHLALDGATAIADNGSPEAPAGEQPRQAAIRADTAPIAVPGAVAGFAMLLALVLAARRARRAVVALAVVALVALAFEGGLHSVHHLGDERSASQCSVASAAPHLIGSPAEPHSHSPLALLIGERLIVADHPALPGRPFRPDAGRAPPPPHPTA